MLYSKIRLKDFSRNAFWALFCFLCPAKNCSMQGFLLALLLRRKVSLWIVFCNISLHTFNTNLQLSQAQKKKQKLPLWNRSVMFQGKIRNEGS